MNIEKILPRNDNVLVRFRMHEMARTEEFSPGGIILPKARNEPSKTEAVEAVVVAAGPGIHTDTWIDHERGHVPFGDGFFCPMDPSIRPGARVLIDRPDTGQRMSDDDREEFRMVRMHNVIAVLEEDEAAE